MTDLETKRCVVAYATGERQFLWRLDLPGRATVADALEAARRLAAASRGSGDCAAAAIPWDSAPVGIFGEPCRREDVPLDGDRIELYRPLRSDPRARRREQARRQRRVGG